MAKRDSHMVNLQTKEDAELFLRSLGFSVKEDVMRKVVNALRDGCKKYELWARGKYPDGRERTPTCAKATVYKVDDCLKKGLLDKYVKYLDIGVEEKEAQAPPEGTSVTVYREETLFILDLARTNKVVRMCSFEDCTLLGPAVLSIAQCIEEQNTFESVTFLALPEEGIPSSIIQFRGCVMRRCVFRDVTLTADADRMDQYRAQFISI